MKKIFTTIFILVAFTIQSFAQFEEVPPMQRLCTVGFSIKQSTVPLTGGYVNIEVTHDRTCKPLIGILVDGSFAPAEQVGYRTKPGLTIIEYKVYIKSSKVDRDIAINVSGGDNINLGQYIRQTGTGGGTGGGTGDIPCSYDAFLLVDGNPVKIEPIGLTPFMVEVPIGPPVGPPIPVDPPLIPLFLQKIPLEGATITVIVEPTSGCDFSNPVISSSIGTLEYSVSSKSYYIIIPAASSARFVDVSITISGIRKEISLYQLDLPFSISLSNQNYIVKASAYKQSNDISVTDINTSSVNVVYYDGLGRPMQEVAAGQSPNRKDIVRPIVYDQFGREAQAFLPYERTGSAGAYTSNTLSEQLTFYTSRYSADAPYAFSKTQYDNSPLNRVTAQTAPGDKWKTSSVKIAYGTNTATEVKLWKTDAAGNPYHSGAKYSAAQLYITETEDETGIKTREYKDKQGQVIETRQNALATSYIYDNFGLLRAVIPPKAQDMAVTAAEFKELIYQYSYDTRNRVIEKKIPGMELQYMVYDNRDRVVMSQDGNLKGTSRWKIYFYDALNRPVAEGTVKSTLVRSTLQGYWNNKEANQTRSAGTYTLTTVAGMPAIETVLSYTYYDDYTWGGYSFDKDAFASAAPAYITPKGQVTGTRVKILDGSEYDVGIGLTSTVYYDFMYRPIQTHTGLYTEGKATVSTNYTFDGLPEKIKEVQTFSGPPTTINQRFVYDGARRATHVYHAINGATEILVAKNMYDNLGRLQAKKQGNGESVTTDYNIRGWIEKSTASKFNYELDYNLNGNIRTQKWNHGASDNVYSYAYDTYNRLLSGTTSGYGENLNYDANGNITKLVRTGGTEAGTYNYTYSGNRLIVLNGNAYEYDANGNAKKDGLRGFNIEYNLLNLPRKVSKGTGSLEYIYDAAGSKLAKILNGTVVNYYCGSVVYTGSKAVEYVAHSEGIAHKSGSGFSYQYNQTDHLGNVRSVADASKAVVQATDYFPFGLAHSTSNLTKNKYLYNGKELQNDVVGGTPFGQLDYGARLYDATIGRFKNQDRFAEKYFSFSPYQYCINNPIKHIDINGDFLYVTNNDAGAWDLFNQIIKEGLGGQFRIYNSKTLGDHKYIVKIKATDGGGDLSQLNEQQKEFYNHLVKITTDESVTTNIGLVKDSKRVVVGSYDTGEIDMGDIASFAVPKGTDAGATPQGKLIHEMEEQYKRSYYGEKPMGRDFLTKAHKNAIAAEDKVNGTTRIKEKWGREIYTTQYLQKNGTTIQLIYTTRSSPMKVARQLIK